MAEDKPALMRAVSDFVKRMHGEGRVDKDMQGLRRTGRLGGGLLEDIQRRIPFYGKDFADGNNRKALSSILFLFFAVLTPAIAFGGLLDELTGQQIGVMEMILATAICGVAFALCGGQPLIVLGGTGPMLVFTGLLYDFSKSLDAPFLTLYFWVGFWSGLFTMVLAVTDASALIRYFSRFTDEIFSTLISLIFIVEVCGCVGVRVCVCDTHLSYLYC